MPKLGASYIDVKSRVEEVGTWRTVRVAGTWTFGDRERQILEFERFWWKYAGAKERAIKESLDMSATRYYQLLNQIIDMPDAVAYDPILVKRLQRLRAFRQRGAGGPPPRRPALLTA